MIHERIIVSVEGQEAYADTYILDNTPEVHLRPLVIICPGGGYEFVSDREAEPVAMQFNAAGFHAIVLHYSVKPAIFPSALLQLAQILAITRSHTAEWNIDQNKIIVAGFSAGGHLAASLGVFWNKEIIKVLGGHSDQYRPDGLILSYPVILSGEFAHHESIDSVFGENLEFALTHSLEKQVDENTPPVFLWHTVEDSQVLVENSMIFANSLRKKAVNFEMHIYQHGGHGLSLGTSETGTSDIYANISSWIKLSVEWVRCL